MAVRLQVEQLRARLRAFSHWHAAHVAQGWRVHAVEAATPPGAGIPFPYRDDAPPVGLRARIDRVDHHPGTGRWAVFDYKTSEAGDGPDATHRRGRPDPEWVDLQLPLYHWLVTRMTLPSGAADRAPGGIPLVPASDPAPRIELGYLLLPRDLDRVGAAMAEWDEATLADGVACARRVLDRLRTDPVPPTEPHRARYPDEQLDALLGRSVLVADGEGGEGAP
ncbi:MAG: PD-(D/E)XK nuclease family protein [Longimicrobiales bacterium]|nr:PD-(D/E)XK nuclease family protein [Longimicrobiales bacterium]